MGNGCLVVDLTGMSGQAPTLCPPSAGMRDPVAVNEEAVCPPNSGKGPSVAPSVTAPDSLLPCGKAKMVGIPPVGCDTDSSFVDLLAVIENLRSELAEVKALLNSGSTVLGGSGNGLPPRWGRGRAGRARFSARGGRGRGPSVMGELPPLYSSASGLHAPPCASGLPGPSLTSGNVELCATSADVGPPGVVSGTSSVDGYNGPEAPSRPPIGPSQHKAHSLKAANPSRAGQLNFTSEKPSSPPARARNLSYARAVRASSGTSPAAFSGHFPSPQSLSFVEPVRDNGRVKVIPPKGISEEGKGDWENTLVGHFLGQKPHYSAVNTLARKLWENDRLEEVLSSENFYFFFKFRDKEAMEWVLDRAPWHLANRPLVLKKWHPNLTLLKEDFKKMKFLCG